MNDEILAHAAAQRDTLTTVIGTIRIWNDRTAAAAAWHRWVASRPPGSASALVRREPTRSRSTWVGRLMDRVRQQPLGSTGRQSAATPFDAAPSSITSSVWLERPKRWRAETRAEGGAETGILVIDGERGMFAVASRDDQGIERLEPGKTSPLGLHAIVAAMIDAEQVLGLMKVEPAGTAVHAERDCFRLVGSLVDPDDFPIWPAVSYDLLLDSEFGILLRFEASSADTRIAGAEFMNVRFGTVIERDVFELSAPRAT